MLAAAAAIEKRGIAPIWTVNLLWLMFQFDLKFSQKENSFFMFFIVFEKQLKIHNFINHKLLKSCFP